MNHIPAETLLGALNWRYAVKKFDPAKKIPAATWSALESALVLAPSTFGLQPWKFIVAQDPAVRAKLGAASFGQTQPVDASHYVVFAVRKNLSPADVDRYIDRIVAVRGAAKAALQGFREIMVGATERARGAGYLDAWMSHQVYIALGQFMASAALLGVDTSPMEGVEPPKYDEILGLAPLGYTTLCGCAAGYRAVDDKYAAAAKVRFPTSEVVLYV
jgi:nitroreductase